MAFDIGNGLSMMGQAISTTFGQAAVEAQKAALEEQKIRLADQLAGAREDKDRAFRRDERLGGEQFTAGQNDLTRALTERDAKLQADTTLAGARISAGATYAAIASREREGVIQFGPNGEAYSVNMYTNKSSPIMDPKNPDKPLILNNAERSTTLRTLVYGADTELKTATTALDAIKDKNSDQYKAALNVRDAAAARLTAYNAQLAELAGLNKPSGVDAATFDARAPSTVTGTGGVTGAPSAVFGGVSGYNAPSPALGLLNQR